MERNQQMCRPIAWLVSAIGSLLSPCCAPALAQNLVMQPQGTSPAVAARPAGVPASPTPPLSPNAPVENPGGAGFGPTGGRAGSAGEQLAGVSLFVVSVPPPKKYAKHDVIEVIVNETSAESFTQTTDMKKDYTLKAELSKFPSLASLFEELALREGIGSVKPAVGVTGNSQLKGTGKLDRKDQVTAKLSAFVVDVKPNGNLVLEARESRSAGKEVTTMVLAGTCRAEDITKNNTVLSAQLAGLTIRIEHEGDVKDSGHKGFFPTILEAVFNF